MHCLTDFKNFARAELDLFEPLTVLLGRNGSGKTNLIEGVELLAALARGVPFHEITDVDRGGTFEVRGGLRSAVRFGAERFGLRFNKARVRNESVDYSIEVVAQGRSDIQLARERLQIGGRTLFQATHAHKDLKVTYDNFSSGRNPTCTLEGARSVLSRYEELISNSRSSSLELRKSRQTVEGVRRYLRKAYIFDPQPKAMRQYERVESAPQLLRNGANLSAVLFALRRKEEEDTGSALRRITETVRQIPEEPFSMIRFVETSNKEDVMLGFLRDGGTEADCKLVDARILSDGTLRMLAVVTALETVPERSRVVVEEFDNGLHPSRARLLVDALAEAADRRKLNVVVTTHNPAFMDALDESQMNNVLICHGDDSGGGSRATRLGDMDIAGTVGLRGGLGDYVTRGALERHLAPGFKDRRAKKTQEWLASLP